MRMPIPRSSGTVPSLNRSIKVGLKSFSSTLYCIAYCAYYYHFSIPIGGEKSELALIEASDWSVKSWRINVIPELTLLGPSFFSNPAPLPLVNLILLL